ncbi:MAG: VCBS repeat-containing protein [bacterium]|nr:VCBS repeat-containing protein [bacterium]
MRVSSGAPIIIALIASVLADRGFPDSGCSITENFDGARSIAAADMDADGDLDILGAARYAGDLFWWENAAGTGARWLSHVVEDDFPGAMAINTADLDSDGDPDILGASWDSSTIAYWINDGSGTRWTRHILDNDLKGATAVCAADLDSDGDLDVLGVGHLIDEIVWWENLDGRASDWAEHKVTYYCEGIGSIQTADLDSDGDPDILTASSTACGIVWWENINGGSEWTGHKLDDTLGEALCAFAADLDSDGDMDIVGAGAGDDRLSWWENADGSGTSWIRRAVEKNLAVCAVHAADLDADGDADIIGASATGDTVRWWENVDGRGTSWYSHTVDTEFGGAYAVNAADLDGDGMEDIVAAALTDDRIQWWKASAVSLVSNTR